MAYRKLGMRSGARQAMFKNIVTSLLKEDALQLQRPGLKT